MQSKQSRGRVAALSGLMVMALWPAAADAAAVRHRAVVRAPAHGRHVHRRTVVVAPVRAVPAVRPWYWGRVVAGVTVGAVLVVAAAGSQPKPPSSTLCWTWTDYAKTSGYWDYCTPPAR